MARVAASSASFASGAQRACEGSARVRSVSVSALESAACLDPYRVSNAKEETSWRAAPSSANATPHGQTRLAEAEVAGLGTRSVTAFARTAAQRAGICELWLARRAARDRIHALVWTPPGEVKEKR